MSILDSKQIIREIQCSTVFKCEHSLYTSKPSPIWILLGRVKESPFLRHCLPVATHYQVTLRIYKQGEVSHFVPVSGNGCRLCWQGHQKNPGFAFSTSLLSVHSHFWHKHCCGHTINLENRPGSKPTISTGLIFNPDCFPLLIHYTSSQ